jgi:hypothetical protein
VDRSVEFGDDGGLNPLPPFDVGPADGGIGYVFVTQQHLLDVGRRYILAAANDRVIGASAESISPCSVLINSSAIAVTSAQTASLPLSSPKARHGPRFELA